jgi:cytochrome o ubiquinol oxidase subunit 2
LRDEGDEGERPILSPFAPDHETSPPARGSITAKRESEGRGGGRARPSGRTIVTGAGKRAPRRAVPALMSAAMLLLLGGCGKASILEPAGPVAAANRTILLNSLTIMLAIVIPTIVATLAFAWWFRAGNKKAKYDPEFVYSGRIELIVWSIPILVILFLSGVIWVGSHQLDPAKPIASKAPPLEVQVVSLDWKWLFIYPGQNVASVNELVVPAGVPVHFSITSASVMNVFFVPRMGSMIYAMNGMQTDLHLQADHVGTFYGQSAHFSGDGFSDMNFMVHAVPPAQFGAWITQGRTAGPVLDGRAYVQLAQQSTDVRPYTYRAVAPGLFRAVVDHKLAPGPGPKVGEGGPEVRPITPGGQK